ncbi:hypothetical protein ISCGN_002003 [Ixodes scapularis]
MLERTTLVFLFVCFFRCLHRTLACWAAEIGRSERLILTHNHSFVFEADHSIRIFFFFHLKHSYCDDDVALLSSPESSVCATYMRLLTSALLISRRLGPFVLDFYFAQV